MASIISWALVLIIGWLSFLVPDLANAYVFWNYILDETVETPYIDPLYVNENFFYIIAVSILLILTVGFGVYCHSIFVKKDISFINIMKSKIIKYNFIPIVCIAILFII